MFSLGKRKMRKKIKLEAKYFRLRNAVKNF